MKVICIKNYYTTFVFSANKGQVYDPLLYKNRTTIGKTYELIQYEDSYGDIGYYFIDDYGDQPIYCLKTECQRHYSERLASDYFMSIEQWREQQLNKILNYLY
jgi:hypothetical protein